MRQQTVFRMAIVMLLVLCDVPLRAEQGEARTSEDAQTKVGLVHQVDLAGSKIVVTVARQMTFTVNGDTNIRRGGDAQRMADIKVGSEVRVTYTRTGDQRIATSIAILGDSERPEKTAAKVPGGNTQVSVQVGGQQRTCLLHVPPAYNATRSLPLVIALHGSRGTGTGTAKMTGFDALADQHGFIAAYPDGIVDPRSWNSLFGTVVGGEGVTADDVDDVAFFRALIGMLHASYHTDSKRVFVCGLSSGAHMSYRLAVALPDLIAAAGIVNGSLGIKSLDGHPAPVTIPQPTEPISLIHICGQKDSVVKFQGAQTPKALFKSVPDCIQLFVKSNGCAAAGKKSRDGAHGVDRTLYSGGRAGTEIELVVVASCGHEWPTERRGLSASQALWEFFSAHPKGTK